MKKNANLITAVAATLMLSGAVLPAAQAQAAAPTNNVTKVSKTQSAKTAGSKNNTVNLKKAQATKSSSNDKNSNISPETLLLTAKTEMTGHLVPYVSSIPNTGKVSLHYHAKNTGFVDGDTSYLAISLPEQFEFLASQPELVNYITGQVTATRLLQDKTRQLSPSNVSVYPDRIIIEVPHSFWVGVGGVDADILIDFGKVLRQANVPVASAPQGYSFVSKLTYASSPWDIFKDPIIGTDSDSVVTNATDAVYE